ncbi:MAG: PTPDL family protein [Verrucomicrobiales bacterium]
MPRLQTFFFATALAIVGATSSADEILLKSGETLSGRITYEADDIVKIEVARSQSIKETKILAREDIEQITKDAPDNVEFAKIQKLVPTRSLMSADAYRSAIARGPEAFLESFPESEHVPKVQEIKATLEEELDKVERGFVKIEDDWISPEDRREFEMLIEARIRFLKMKGLAGSESYNGFINAMREFEAIEENYYGSPAFPRALELAREIVPKLGRRLQGMRRDLEYRMAEFERNKAALDAMGQEQIEAARAREEASYKSNLEADKKAGIKWVRLNPRSKDSIEGYLKLASEELSRLKAYDIAALREQAEMLVEVDKLIAKRNLERAKMKLSEAAAITGKKAGAKSSKSKKSGSYIAALGSKISTLQAEAKAKEKSEADAARSRELSANLRKGDEQKPKEDAEPSEETEEKDTDGGAAAEPEKPAEEAEEESPTDAFSALADVTEKPEARESAKARTTKSASKSRADKNDAEDEDRKERSRPPAADGGGFPLSRLVPILTVLLVVTVVVLKVLGIGDKKEAE